MPRIKDDDLLAQFMGMSCAVCMKWPPNDAHHVRSKGSMGDDIPNNLITLCREHHRLLHDKGLKRFVELYPCMELVLQNKEWYQREDGKWYNDKVYQENLF